MTFLPISPTAAIPVRIRPPPGPLPAAQLFRAMVRNMMETWPEAVYEHATYRRRLLNRETLFVMEPDLIRQVLVDDADKFVKSAVMTRSLAPALGSGLLTSDGQRWRWQRRAAAPTFRPDRMAALVPPMIAAAERTRDRWLARPGEVLDISREMMRTTFDIIVETVLPGLTGVDVERVERAMTDYLESTSWTAALALLRAPRWVPFPGQFRAERARRFLRGEILRVVRAARAGRAGGNDLTAMLLEAEDPETGRRMDDRELADNLITFVTAGHETTALALTWAFYLLDLFPDAADRVLAEIRDVTGGELRAEHVPNLVYTRQVLQEALRLYPPAPILVREAAEDLTVGRERVRSGSSVFVPVYAVHRHRSLWPDPDRFDPDRFQPEETKRRHRYAYLPFGAGPRICIGMGFALLEAVAVLAVLLPAVRPEATAVPGLKMRVTLRPASGMPMRVMPR